MKSLDLFHYILVFVILFWFSSLLQPIQVLVSKILTSIYLWKLAILPHFNFQTPNSEVWSSFRRWILLLFQSLWFSVGILMAFLETSCLQDLTFTTLTIGILVRTILTVMISFTTPKPLCEHYIMGPLFLMLQSLLIPYLQPRQLPVSKSILLLTITFSQ